MRSTSILSFALSVALAATSIPARADTPITTTTAPAGATTVTVLVPVEPSSHVRLSGRTPGLTLDRRSGVTLQSGIVVDEEWTAICAAPCDAILPADGHYRVSAPDTEPQYVPRLHGQDADLSADLKGNGTQALGLGVVLAGVAAIGIGTGLLISEASHSMEMSRPGSPKESVSLAPGIVTLSLSLPLMIVGGIICGSGQGSLTVSMHGDVPEVSIADGVSLSPEGIVF